MLLLFVYPLRKRWRAMREVGSTRFWFAFHMTLGIAGPAADHRCTRRCAFGSLNATVAFASMALVAGSGIVGRFLYARIHHGLYGRRATLAELRAQAGIDSEAVRSKLAFVPHVEERLDEFARRAEAAGDAGSRIRCGSWRSGCARCRAALVHAEATQVLRRVARRRRLAAEKLGAADRQSQRADRRAPACRSARRAVRRLRAALLVVARAARAARLHDGALGDRARGRRAHVLIADGHGVPAMAALIGFSAAWLATAAGAQSLEGVLMPGKVIAGHAKFEQECANCHVKFDKAAQDGLCLDCHKEVARDVRDEARLPRPPEAGGLPQLPHRSQGA